MKAWIGDRFGSRRGLARLVRYQVGWWLRPGRLPATGLDSVTRLVFVCRGNICRSAVAEAIARTLDFPACSFGTHTHLGKPANPGMAEAAALLGYDLSGHRTTPLEHYSPDPGDLVLVFEPGHLDELRAGVGRQWQIELLGAWARPCRPYIHDPFEGTAQYYARVARLIQGAVETLVGDIRRRDA
jgi:protein-tyrosine phosphatase